MPARIVKADEARAAQVAETATEAPLYGSIRVSQRYFGAFRGFSWMI